MLPDIAGYYLVLSTPNDMVNLSVSNYIRFVSLCRSNYINLAVSENFTTLL